jgi:hypothetical protein
VRVGDTLFFFFHPLHHSPSPPSLPS